jgi:hypothetical protein
MFYRIRVHADPKSERLSMSGADYANLIAATHTQLAARSLSCGTT